MSRTTSLLALLTVVLAVGLATAQGQPTEGTIDPAAVSAEKGFCYTVGIQASCKPDTPAASAASYLRLFENDQELGPAHSMHQTIRDAGEGAFSHWSGDPSGQPAQLYFSASDNTDPRRNGRRYRWAIIRDARGNPIPPPPMPPLPTSPCQLQAVPDQPLTRDRHTTLLANFDDDDSNDAIYARVHRQEVGVGSKPDAPGKFGGGVCVDVVSTSVMYPGLDNVNPLVGQAEFWAKASGQQPLWNDGKEHWLLVVYPERAGASARHGTAPCFLTLCKMADDTLRFSVQRQSIPHYGAGVGLRAGGQSVSLPAAGLKAEDWHHILVSWDLRAPGRIWLLVNGQGLRGDLKRSAGQLPPNPAMNIVFGGLWGLPGDNVAAAQCFLDDLRVADCTVEKRLAGAPAPEPAALDEARLLQEMDLSRAMLDQLLSLQFHGGWAAAYQWPTYTPTGWGLVGRGVDMWFAYSSWAGAALLRGWMLWGDDRYLEGAREAADMFCRTQRANGTWSDEYTYGRGEFAPWGNYAYIAQAMQSNQIRFLAMMYRVLGEERYGQALRKAGDWMVSIQFPSGAWGWEAYPADHTGPYGHPALNDAVTPQAMLDLFVIWCAMTKEGGVSAQPTGTPPDGYLQAVLKGAQWIIQAQAGPPTYGWADQYNEKNEFIWMRNFEPPAVSMQAINSAATGLCFAYDLTGSGKYLEPLRKVLTWLDAIPQEQRGWLWYDPKTSVPVVAYYNEMLPVTDPKAVREIIPRLDAHYGTKYPWQGDAIRAHLKAREQGPVYPDWRGRRPRSQFGEAPTVADRAAAYQADRAKGARDWLAAWAAGKPPLNRDPEYGQTFDLGAAVSHCQNLIGDIENALVAFGDIPGERLPRYSRGHSNDWVWMEPQRDYYATPLGQGQQ
ncbi:hypothetical protein LLH23_20095 [bacterium]|nr:hypothetical protein [bacterium]